MSTAADTSTRLGQQTRPGLNPVIATLAYLWSATMVFGGFLSAWFVLRADAPMWPPPGQPRLPLAVSSANTVVLLASGALLILAGRTADMRQAAVWLRRAALLGGLFLLIQGFEWVRMIGHGLRVSTGAYGSTFYTLVGTHALHALGGFVILLVTATGTRLNPGRRAACILYWGFVVTVWPFLYVVLYYL